MSFLKFGGQCVCGGKIKTHVKKPTAITPTITRVSCRSCGTRLLVQAFIEKGSSPRKYGFGIDIIELSKKVEKIIKERLANAS